MESLRARRDTRTGMSTVMPPISTRRTAESWFSYRTTLVVEPANDERGVVAAEAERVRQRDVELRCVTRLVRNVVEIAVGIRRFVVDRRRELAVVHGKRGEDRLDRAGRTEAVTGRALRRRHRRPQRMLV